MGKNSKRPKSYYINTAKRIKNNELTIGMKGFLCTTNRSEKDCVKEAYNILNEFSKILHGNEEVNISSNLKANDNILIETPEKSQENDQKVCKKIENSSDSESEDIEAALKNEVAALQNKNSESNAKRQFQQVFVRVNNCIFISTTLDNPVDLSLAIMDSIIESQKAKTHHLVKLLPVQMTCKAFIDEILKATKELVLEYLPKGKLSFYISFRARNNNSVERESVYKSISTIITDFNSEASADYKTPDVVLNVDVVKNICCLALLPEFMTKYCKYNLIRLAEQFQDKNNEDNSLIQEHGGQSLAEDNK